MSLFLARRRPKPQYRDYYEDLVDAYLDNYDGEIILLVSRVYTNCTLLCTDAIYHFHSI